MAATAPAPTAAVLPLYAEKASPVGMDAQPASAAPSSGLPSVAAALDQQLVNVTSRLGVRPDQVEGAKRVVVEQVRSLRPWSQFFRLSAFSRPLTFSEGQQRLLYNLTYYRSNYFVVFLGLTAYMLITNLLLLASLVAIVGFYIVAMRMSGDALHVGPITVSRMQLNLIVGFVSLLLLYISSAGSTLGFLILISGLLIAGHAICIEMVPPEAEFV